MLHVHYLRYLLVSFLPLHLGCILQCLRTKVVCLSGPKMHDLIFVRTIVHQLASVSTEPIRCLVFVQANIVICPQPLYHPPLHTLLIS